VSIFFGDGTRNGRARLGMEHRFFVEAKAFTFLVEAGRSELRL
jgi:hypothetical protein